MAPACTDLAVTTISDMRIVPRYMCYELDRSQGPEHLKVVHHRKIVTYSRNKQMQLERRWRQSND